MTPRRSQLGSHHTAILAGGTCGASRSIFGSLLFVLVLGCISPSKADDSSERPVRGVWVANVASGALSSPQRIEEFVEQAEACGLNTLYVVVWNRGFTTYPSPIMQREFGQACDPRYVEFDVLKEFVTAAHARKMRVIAWFEFGFSCSYRKPDGGPLIRKYPEWAARDYAGKLATKNGFQWMNAFHPEVQEFLLSLIHEVLENYQVDGIQGDDRLPACPSIAGYDPWTVLLYQQEHGGVSPPKDHLDPDWVDWRANLLNQFMERLYEETKGKFPEAIVSMAPSIYPWSKQQYLQDWPTWVKNGWVDEICPQIYREDVAAYQHELGKIVNEQVSPENRQLIKPGILIRTSERIFNDAKNIKQIVDANRELGLPGEVFFYDAVVTQQPELFKSLYRAE